MSYLVLFCSCVFSPFSITITSLGKERANLSAFRTFVRFVLVWFCRFSFPLGVSEGRGTPWTFLLSFCLCWIDNRMMRNIIFGSVCLI